MTLIALGLEGSDPAPSVTGNHSIADLHREGVKNVVKNLRQEIITLGGEVNFNSKLDGVFFENNRLTQISINGQRQNCEYLCLCIGHSARDTFKMLYNK